MVDKGSESTFEGLRSLKELKMHRAGYKNVVNFKTDIAQGLLIKRVRLIVNP